MNILTERRLNRIKKYSRISAFIFLIITIISAIFILTLYIYLKSLGPPQLAVPQSTIYYAADGTIIGETNSGQKRYWVDLENISPHLINATISVEDKRFYNHFGIDLKRIGGALLANLKATAKVQGASTITQQYARNLFLEHNKSWKRKLTEILYAFRLEMNYTKDDILEGYLNTINYGHGTYGVEAASQYYFNKTAAQLTLNEATMLAGIPKGPSKFSPFVAKDKANNRQAVILNSMVKNGFINEETASKTLDEELEFHGEHNVVNNEIAPYFQDAVKRALNNELALHDRTIALGGLKIYTTLNLNDQKIAENIIKNTLPNDSKIQVGFVAMNPQNGFVTALVGGRDYTKSPFNRATQSLRQPGSTLKPILYYTALENGFTPSSTMRSERTTFHFDDNGEPYTPANFNNNYANKEITLAQALALSDNIYAVKTHLFLGENTLSEAAKRFGISTKMAEVPSLALGTSEVRLIDMARAFSLFANNGKKVEPVFIKRIEDYRGEVIYEHKKSEDLIIDPQLAFVMTHLMTGIFDPKLNGYASVTGQTMINKMTRPYAGKSGTTKTDNWMIGFSPQLTAAVWTGYDQNEHIKLTAERSSAKNIWIDFMEKAHEDLPVKGFKEHENTIGVYVDPESGLIASDSCPVKRLTYFVRGTEPVEYCIAHESSDNNNEIKIPEKKRKKLPWYKRLFRFGR